MKKIIIFLIFTSKILTINKVNLKVLNKNKTNSEKISLNIDFGYNKILISTKNFDCSSLSCQIIQKSIPLQHRQKKFSSDKAIIFFQALNSNKKINSGIIVYLINTNYSNIWGVGPNSDWAINFSDYFLKIDLFTNEILFIKKPSEDYLNNLDVFIDEENNGNQTYFLKSKFNYRENDGFSYGTNVDVKLCFHDFNILKEQNYFLEGNNSFVMDWNYYQEKMRKKDFKQIGAKLGYRILDGKGVDDYVVDFDNDLWNFYDFKPMKAFVNKTSGFCEMFLGKFFMHRSGFSLVFGKKLDQSLESYFTVEERDYVKMIYERNNFYVVFFVILVLVFTTVIFYVCYKKLNKEFKKKPNYYGYKKNEKTKSHHSYDYSRIP